MSHEKQLIARSQSYQNGVKLAGICNPLEQHCKCWVLTIPQGQYVSNYGAYADTAQDAMEALCRYDLACENSGATENIVPRFDDRPIKEIQKALSTDRVIPIQGHLFDKSSIQVESANFYRVSPDFEALLNGQGLDKRLFHLQRDFASLLIKRQGSADTAARFKMHRLLDTYQKLGGHVMGAKMIQLVGSADMNPADIQGLEAELKDEFEQSGISIHAFRIHSQGRDITVAADSNEFDRLSLLCRKVMETDPMDRIVMLGESKNPMPYISEVGNNAFHAHAFLSQHQQTERKRQPESSSALGL